MERLPLTNYISTKVSSTTKNGEKYGENGMGERGDELGGGRRMMEWVVVGRVVPPFVDLEMKFCGARKLMRHRNQHFCGAPGRMRHRNVDFYDASRTMRHRKRQFMWRTEDHAPQKWRKTMIGAGPTDFLWRK